MVVGNDIHISQHTKIPYVIGDFQLHDADVIINGVKMWVRVCQEWTPDPCLQTINNTFCICYEEISVWYYIIFIP